MNLLLGLHSYLRYGILILFAYSLFLFFKSFKAKSLSDSHKKVHKILTIVSDVQLVLGFVLFSFFSPIVQHALSDMKSAMKDKELRFFTVEHTVMMFLVVVFLHILNFKAKKSPDSPSTIRLFAIFYSLVLVLFIVGIPWFRPLFRGFE